MSQEVKKLKRSDVKKTSDSYKQKGKKNKERGLFYKRRSDNHFQDSWSAEGRGGKFHLEGVGNDKSAEFERMINLIFYDTEADQERLHERVLMNLPHIQKLELLRLMREEEEKQRRRQEEAMRKAEEERKLKESVSFYLSNPFRPLIWLWNNIVLTPLEALTGSFGWLREEKPEAWKHELKRQKHERRMAKRNRAQQQRSEARKRHQK